MTSSVSLPFSLDASYDALEAQQPAVPTVHVLIVAAGKGSRFGASVPKQYTAVCGKTILEQSVTALSQSEHVNDLHLVIAADDTTAKTLEFDVPVRFAEGGDERWQSVQSGVDAILQSGAIEDDLILIHDAARPCVLKAHIDAVIDVATLEPYGAILGVPVADTLKRVAGDNQIETTVDRSQLWQAQTPQVFRAGKLRDVLQQVEAQGVQITDEASAFELMGYPIAMVHGNNQNLKLTYAEDLSLIEAILSSR